MPETRFHERRPTLPARRGRERATTAALQSINIARAVPATPARRAPGRHTAAGTIEGSRLSGIEHAPQLRRLSRRQEAR